jgi:hypothetical protein
MFWEFMQGNSDSSEPSWPQQLFHVLAAHSDVPHEPVLGCDALSQIDRIVLQLPFQTALSLPHDYRDQRLRAREQCDNALKRVIVELADRLPGEFAVVNHCSVFGRHGRELARRLDRATVIAADVSPTWERLFHLYEWLQARPAPRNYRFVRENVYHSELDVRPGVVCFFGACGTLADGVIDLAVRLAARYIVGRACCHDNIAMNLTIDSPHYSMWNVGHRIKNHVYRYCHNQYGYYFDPRFDEKTYPRSSFARRRLGSRHMLAHARHAVDCRLCRVLIDVDRLLRLEESGYHVLGYRESMFIAERRDVV